MGGTGRVVTIALLCASLLACRVPITSLVLPEPPTDQQRASFGKVAVLTAVGNPPLEMSHAVVGWPAGAGLGLAVGLLTAVVAITFGALYGLIAGAPLLLVGIVTMLLGAALGAALGAYAILAYPIFGAIHAESADPLAAAMRSIPAAMAELDLHRLLRDAMVRAGAEEGRVLTPLEGDADDPDPRTFAGFDTVLEVRLLGLWDGGHPLSGTNSFFAPFSHDFPLHVAAQARLLRPDGAPIHGTVLTYVSPRRALRLSEWGARGARAFREESKAAVEELGRSIVEEAFFTTLEKR